MSDLKKIERFISSNNPAAAVRIRNRLKEAAANLQEYYDRGRLTGSGMRELLHVRPYVLRYIIGPKGVTIIHVRHSAQRRLP